MSTPEARGRSREVQMVSGAYLPGLTPIVRKRIEATIKALSDSGENKHCLVYIKRDLVLREKILCEFIRDTVSLTEVKFRPEDETKHDFIVLHDGGQP